ICFLIQVLFCAARAEWRSGECVWVNDERMAAASGTLAGFGLTRLFEAPECARPGRSNVRPTEGEGNNPARSGREHCCARDGRTPAMDNWKSTAYPAVMILR